MMSDTTAAAVIAILAETSETPDTRCDLLSLEGYIRSTVEAGITDPYEIAVGWRQACRDHTEAMAAD